MLDEDQCKKVKGVCTIKYPNSENIYFWNNIIKMINKVNIVILIYNTKKLFN